MHLETIDWVIIVAYLILSLVIGILLKEKAGKSLTDFFLGGRSMPWYLAGVSMVATTFAADTPLAVTELVAKNGISGNWLWWNMLLGGMLTVFFFARLWRRAEILTEPEFIELRYGGKPAALLRGFKAFYLGLFMNCLIIGWVNLAMVSIIEVFFGVSKQEALLYVAVLMVLTSVYSAISGLWGVALTDAIQFIIAMTGCIILAFFVVGSDEIGGISGLKEKLPETYFNFFPSIGTPYTGKIANTLTLGIGSFLAYMCIWWASWYPGAEPGGGGYVAQRMMSAKNEKHSVLATLFFQVAHYCLRPWPWIIVALCTLVLYPELEPEDKKLGYVMVMRDFLPAGLRGLLLVAFLAAYMSTLSTQLNWGSSYVVNDFYKRFIRKESSFPDITSPHLGMSSTGGREGLRGATAQRHYITVSRITTVALMLVSLWITTIVDTISGVWGFIIECGAGLGLVLILRWYWWRINAWSEITATVAPFIFYGISKWLLSYEFPNSFFITVGGTTLSWLVVTYLTPPEKDATLNLFYKRVTPSGWWGSVAKTATPQVKNGVSIKLVSGWLSAVLFTYSILFLSGKLIFGFWIEGLVWLAVASASSIVLYFSLTPKKHLLLIHFENLLFNYICRLNNKSNV